METKSFVIGFLCVSAVKKVVDGFWVVAVREADAVDFLRDSAVSKVFAVPWLAAVEDADACGWKPKVLSLVFSATLR